VEEGYTIPKERYYLPEIEFTPEEMSALFVASLTPGEEGAAEQAALKLQAGSQSTLGDTGQGPITAGPDMAGPRLLEVAEATFARRSIRFRYRPNQGEPMERHVDPYALVWRTGHWYVVGLDRDRGEPRSFRVSRFLSGVTDAGDGSSPPEGFDAREQLKAGPWGIGEPAGRATVAFAPDVAWWAVSGVPGATRVATREEGWVEVTLPAGALDSMASWVLSFGPDAEAVEPSELRDEIVARLEATLGAS
jgi:proteasome accessory factor B